MPLAFSGTTDEVQTAIATVHNVTFGTWALICRKTGASGSNYNLVRSATSGAANRFGLFVNTAETLVMACDANLSNGPTVGTGDGWVFIAGGKATGSSTPRFHKLNYNAINSGMTHSNGSAAIANATAPGTTGHIFIGSRAGGPCWVGEILIAGLWSRNLADLECEQLAFSRAAWLASGPVGLWTLMQGATTTAVRDETGGGADETSRSGTTISSQSAVPWNFGARVLAVRGQAAAGPSDGELAIAAEVVGNQPEIGGHAVIQVP